MTTEIKLSRRLAERLLNNYSCRVIIEEASPSFVWVTEPGINNGKVHIPNEQITVSLEEITKIEYEDRFGNISFIGVDWKNER